MRKILIVEDDRPIAELERDYLEANGFAVEIAFDGREGLRLARTEEYALLLLDVMLPGISGFEICREVRKSKNVPVVMVTARKDDVDKIRGLGLGADDYVVKPFNPAEVVARVQAVLRRSRGKDETPADVLRIGKLEIDLEAFHARINQAGIQHPLPLTLTEFRLLAHLARAPRRVFSRGELITACLSSEGDVLERTVDSHMSKLRKKLEDAGLPGVPVSLRGVGYRLEEVA